MEEIRARLLEVRRRVGLTQGEFATKMGVKQNTWSNIEHGVNPCSDRYINLICLTYNVRKVWLETGQGGMFESNSPHAQILDDDGNPLPPEVAELVTIYNELVPLNQKAVLDFLETTLQSQRNTVKALKKETPADN